VYISEPEKSGSHLDVKTSRAPDLILLNTWLNAQPKHIAKYALVYRTLYPLSTIILATSTWHNWAYRSNAAQNASLAPVVDYVLSLPPTAKILLHLFSNGGAWTATQIAFLYKQKTGKPLPLSKMIFDSSPGLGSYSRTTSAFTISLPTWKQNPIWRGISLVWIHVGMSIATIIGILLRKEETSLRLRRRLNDKTMFNGAAERLYIYGDKDTLVPPEDVESHAVWSKAEGWKVTQERFVDGGHVTHVTVDPKRYWAAVEKHWNSDGK